MELGVKFYRRRYEVVNDEWKTCGFILTIKALWSSKVFNDFKN